MKKIKLLSLMGLLTLASSTGIVLSTSLNNLVVENESTKIETIKNTAEQSYPIEKAQSNGQNSFLSTPTGPLVYWKDEITSLDWFGAKRWSIDMKKITGISSYPSGSSWQRAWFNWDYDRTRNILWVLGFGGSNTQQKLYSFNGISGEKIGEYSLSKRNTDYRFMSALVSGNVLVYGGAGSDYNAKVELWDVGSKSLKEVQGDSYQGLTKPNNYSNTKWYFYNLIPISNNKNIVQLMNFPNQGGTTGDGGASHASYQVDFLLVDDNMNFISKTASNKWHKQVNVIENGVEGFRNSTITPQRDYYFLLDGRVVSIIYNTVVIIDPKSNDSANSNVSIYKYQLDPKKWVLSWSFDTNENLFFKYKNDKKIYRVKASELKSGSSAVSPATYFDIENASNEISKYADNYILYNVYGYRGQIVLINAAYSDYIDNSKAPNDTDASEKQYGLQVAITENKSSQESGDSLGLLNGPDSFQKSVDFEIKENIYKNKLPSEITRNDITILNNGFFTTNQTKENGNLKYPPFKLDKINDSEGSFEITVNLDQVPWFASTLPTDSIPKTIKKTFNQTATISKKVSWNQNLSYDLKNTLPTKVELSEIEKFNPFQVSFNSRTVLDSNGKVLYPKTTYSITGKDDTKGELVVTAKYDYMPVSQEVNTPQTFSSNTTYTLFKNSDQKGFYFAGSDNKATSSSGSEININQVSQLKGLSESNLLPSSFKADNKDDFLQFINTNKSTGYPISKMNFSVQPNDTEGSLTITATMPNGYYGNGTETFTQKYVGLNKTSEYKFSFKENISTIGNKKISDMLPNAVTEGDIVENFITYSGFNSSDFSVVLNPNNDAGTLNVQIVLNSNYSSILGNSYGFSNYRIQKTLTGFLNKEGFNSQYNIVFHDDSSEKLIELKKKTLSDIKTQLDNKNLTINGTQYTNLNQLVEQLLIKSKGSKIPSNWSSNDNIKTNMSINNDAGIMNISLTINSSIIDGYSSDLNFVFSYSGFVKGNIIATNDNLSFVGQDLLYSLVPEVKGKSASEFKTWLENNKKDNIKKLLLSVTGEYETIINSGQDFEVFTEVNDSYNTITVGIKFNKTLNNTNSLTEYTIQYKLS